MTNLQALLELLYMRTSAQQNQLTVTKPKVQVSINLKGGRMILYRTQNGDTALVIFYTHALFQSLTSDSCSQNAYFQRSSCTVCT